MSNQPFFSIIVPTYNQVQFLGAALDSIIAQTDSDWEAIVVNDGSTDATPELMEAYALKDSRIRIFHKSNGGVASALNEGRKQALGQWLCWLSSDDMFDPHKLEIHREWIERYPDCHFFFTYFRLLRESTGEITDHDLWGPIPEREFQILVLFYRNYISGISVCINREAWDRVGMMDEDLRYGQDFDMWLRLLAVYPGRFIPQWTCINRNHALQGSEVFPQACYFDTAKAAIRFLNDHHFEDFFPLLDLSDPDTSLRALRKTLEIAAEPSAFLYSLGPHPALLFRILEWIWGMKTKRSPLLQQSLENEVRSWIPRILQQQNSPGFNLFWKAAAAATQLANPKLDYQPIPPAVIGEMYYYANRTAGNEFLEPLEEYLLRYNKVQVKPWTGKSSDQEIVMLLPLNVSLSDDPPDRATMQILKLARDLSQRGFRILLVGHFKQSIGLMEGILFLGAETQYLIEKMIAGLGVINTLIRISPSGVVKARATRIVDYDLPGERTDESSTGEQLIQLINDAPISRDYFQFLSNRVVALRKGIGRKLFRMRQLGFHILKRVKFLLSTRYKF